jgi:hypothetical protein
MAAYARNLKLKSMLPSSAPDVLAAITVILASLLGCTDIAHAQDSRKPSFSRSGLEADLQAPYTPFPHTSPKAAHTQVAGAGLIINPTFNANIDSATRDVINNVINFYESTITTNITVNIEFHNMNTGLGGSFSVVYGVPYSSFRTALANAATSADDTIALANTPAGSLNPINGTANIAVKSPNGRAIGLNTPEVPLSGGGSPCPGFTGSGCIGINVPLANSRGYLAAVLQHEIDEVLGLGSALRGTTTPTTPWAQDLFRWSSPGVRSYAATASQSNPCNSPSALFSIDGGVTNLNEFNNCNNGGDYGDWIMHTPSQVQDAFTNFTGVPFLTLTSSEMRGLDVIGYNLSSGGSLAVDRDFNGDHTSDILWRHTSGAVSIWLLNGVTITGQGSPGGATTDWSIAGVGDFNGDGKSDILWRHTSGALYEWLLNGGIIIGQGSPGGATTDWSVAGVGDFNGDGMSDILWRHSTGTVYEWLLNGTSIIGQASPGGATTDWGIAGVGDFNGDGRSDVLWRHTSGALYEWLLNGGSIIGQGSPGAATTDWSIAGVGDFNGDGKSDILWRHNTGTVYEWLLNGTTIIGQASPGGASTDWTIVRIGDFNGDGKSDILWRQNTGAVYEWLLNGTVIAGQGSPGGAGTDWQIQ